MLVAAALPLTPGYVLPLAIVVVIAVGTWAIGRAAGAGDPGWVVIDEVAGQWLAMVPLIRPSLVGCVLAFALFRLFDIAKPGPVGWVDRRHGAWAVMGDDVAAGAIAACCMAAARWFWPGLLD